MYKLICKIILMIGCCHVLNACSSKFESDFKQGCRGWGGSSSFCRCTYKQVEQYYGKERLAQVGEGHALLPNDWADRLQLAGQRCSSKL
ncbi:hypothetical protein [Acinetobacter sp. ANC 5502]